MKFENIKKSKEFSKEKINAIKKEFKDSINNKNISIITTGSFARDEANELSDLDIFIIVKNNTNELLFEEKEKISQIVSKHIPKNVGDSGTFGIEAIETIENLLINLGGNKDDNAKFTRRMLFLLESKSLYNEEVYNDAKNRLIDRYVDISITDDQLTRFLLNDFIRYYRTITTDFEYKVSEAGKSWGLRNIKLTFSRKILYFAGVLAVAETYQKKREDKIETLQNLLELSPIERIEKICKDEGEKALCLYDEFLSKISNNSIREILEKVQRERRKEYTEYVELKNISKEFSKELQNIVEKTFDKSHPIHNALLF
ncbi:conserved hypothetical protein [Aliarcobacter butzleri JV22]|uniref:nucleotidyltransferase domain-containing protein n=1 Tax=Aliarcobacter butzleri TaxID=28197 RepID=UPI0001F162CD|nr:nucleotidyltransferase domain-containing protein [Aliarcobacter butzleri]EFU70296.1 conserved hypothetical protein [Aliarcobacter butzleri JV22]